MGAGHHRQALLNHPSPANHRIHVHFVTVVEQGDEERSVGKDAHSDDAAANSSSCV